MIQVDCPLPERPGQITGVTTQCPDVSGQIYEVSEVGNATSYTWIVPAGWQIDSGQGTRRINVTTGSAGEGGEISVTASNTCGTSAARTLIVAVTGNVGTPSIPNTSSSTICQGTASSVFTTLALNATDYVWSVTGTGNTITGTGTTGTVTWAPAF